MSGCYPIPAEALDDRLGIVGTSGAGKTYTAMGAVERLLASGARCVIVDPLDVWWGLRLSADGERASKFKLPILGGSHGDLPLTENSGALIGETVSGMADSCIVSLGGFSSGAAERRFMLAFLNALYRRSSGSLFHLVLDEADLWAPQQVLDKDGGTMQLKGVVEGIVRRGRVKGFIPWLITQRPAVIDKSVMSMMVGLIAMKAMSPQDRGAILAWLKGQMTTEQLGVLDAAMPQLNIGEGIVWIPGRNVLSQAQFPTKATFDSSRAPQRGEAVAERELKPLDLGALQDRLSTVEAEVKANDPKVLKAEVARLTAELRKAPPAGASDAVVERAKQEGYHAGHSAGFLEGVAEGEKRGNPAGQALMLTRVRNALDGLKVDAAPAATSPIRQPIPETSTAPASVKQPPAPRQVAAAPPPSDGSVPAGCAKPLAALAAVYPSGLTEAQWATAAGYKRSGGTWGTYKSRLRGAGLIDGREGRWFATEAGAAAAGDVERPPAPGPDLVRWWAAKLPGTTKLAEALIEAWPNELDRDELAARVGMSASGGSFGTYLSRLAGPALIERSGRTVRLSAEAMEAP